MALDIIEFNHVNVTVPREREESAKHFYRDVLGLEEIIKPDASLNRGGAWYKQGSIQIHLSIEDDVQGNHQSKRHVCYVVRDLSSAEQRFRDAGVEIIPDHRPPVPGWPRFYVRDPGGNLIEIAQRDSEN